VTNNDHAARLREMAQEQLDMAKTLTPMYSSGLIATCRADAAALLAGAEALENLEVAKAALREIAAGIDCGCVPCTGQCRSQSALSVELEVRQDVAIAALARLEGK
jgi:hypothetical protein